MEESAISREQILFDSLSSHLSLSVVFQQFLLHLSYPLLLPYYWWRYGLTFMYTQGFALDRLSVYDDFCWHFIRNHLFLQGVTTLITQSMMLLMIVSAYIAYDEVGSQVLFPIGVYCMHRLMVGLKYGTLSPTEYR